MLKLPGRVLSGSPAVSSAAQHSLVKPCLIKRQLCAPAHIQVCRDNQQGHTFVGLTTRACIKHSSATDYHQKSGSDMHQCSMLPFVSPITVCIQDRHLPLPWCRMIEILVHEVLSDHGRYLLKVRLLKLPVAPSHFGAAVSRPPPPLPTSPPATTAACHLHCHLHCQLCTHDDVHVYAFFLC